LEFTPSFGASIRLCLRSLHFSIPPALLLHHFLRNILHCCKPIALLHTQGRLQQGFSECILFSASVRFCSFELSSNARVGFHVMNGSFKVTSGRLRQVDNFSVKDKVAPNWVDAGYSECPRLVSLPTGT